ncbi:MAG TPA: ATPase, partial [Acinetobacter nosocomialis]|nr:ATPase [Acinetobacter nosocomialis]
EVNVNNIINKIKQEPMIGEMVHQDYILIGKSGERQQVHLQSLKVALVNPSTSLHLFCNSYLKYSTLILNGSNRINLVNMQPAGNLQAPPHTSFQVLFRDNAKRDEVRRIIHEAFGQYLVIDPTNLGNL